MPLSLLSSKEVSSSLFQQVHSKIYFYKEVANAVRAQQSIKFNLFHIVDCVTCFLFFWQLLHFPMAAAGFSLVARRISPQIFRSFSPKINLQQARRTVPLNELCRSTFALQHRLRYDSIKVRFLLVIQNIANHFPQVQICHEGSDGFLKYQCIRLFTFFLLRLQTSKLYILFP